MRHLGSQQSYKTRRINEKLHKQVVKKNARKGVFYFVTWKKIEIRVEWAGIDCTLKWNIGIDEIYVSCYGAIAQLAGNSMAVF